MSLSGDEAWYVGDQLFDDVLGAGQVGLTTIWIDRSGGKVPKSAGVPEPDATISDLRELVALLDGAN
jgi:FMN phosphatase YigB (HAD superfamily)